MGRSPALGVQRLVRLERALAAIDGRHARRHPQADRARRELAPLPELAPAGHRRHAALDSGHGNQVGVAPSGGARLGGEFRHPQPPPVVPVPHAQVRRDRCPCHIDLSAKGPGLVVGHLLRDQEVHVARRLLGECRVGCAQQQVGGALQGVASRLRRGLREDLGVRQGLRGQGAGRGAVVAGPVMSAR